MKSCSPPLPQGGEDPLLTSPNKLAGVASRRARVGGTSTAGVRFLEPEDPEADPNRGQPVPRFLPMASTSTIGLPAHHMDVRQQADGIRISGAEQATLLSNADLTKRLEMATERLVSRASRADGARFYGREGEGSPFEDFGAPRAGPSPWSTTSSSSVSVKSVRSPCEGLVSREGRISRESAQLNSSSPLMSTPPPQPSWFIEEGQDREPGSIAGMMETLMRDVETGWDSGEKEWPRDGPPRSHAPMASSKRPATEPEHSAKRAAVCCTPRNSPEPDDLASHSVELTEVGSNEMELELAISDDWTEPMPTCSASWVLLSTTSDHCLGLGSAASLAETVRLPGGFDGESAGDVAQAATLDEDEDCCAIGSENCREVQAVSAISR